MATVKSLKNSKRNMGQFWHDILISFIFPNFVVFLLYFVFNLAQAGKFVQATKIKCSDLR